MKTVIKLFTLCILISLISCRDSTNFNNLTDNCFIIGGCEQSYYDLKQLLIRLDITIDNNYTVHHLLSYNNSENPKININLPPLHRICGNVKYLDAPVYATIIFILQNSTKLFPTITSTTDENGYFCTLLTEGTYSIIVSPYKNDAIPQIKREVSVNTDITNLIINYPSPENVRYIYGNIILDTKSGLPIEGLNVLAFKEYSEGISIQSNISFTDQNGRFSLIIPSMDEIFSLLIYGSEKNPDWPVIKLKDIITEGILQIGTISLEFIPKLKHTSGTVLTDEETIIIATMKDDTFTYTKNFTTDSEGYFETDLREGKYSFLIIPQDIYHSKWSITAFEDISIPQPERYKFSIDQKVSIKGNLRTNYNKIQPKINMKRLGGCNNRNIDNIFIENSILPDEDGNFSTLLHKGLYRIEISSKDSFQLNLISEPICIDKDIDLKEIFLPELCQISIKIKNFKDFTISSIKAEAFLSNLWVNDFVKISEQNTTSDTINLYIPIYFCNQ